MADAVINVGVNLQVANATDIAKQLQNVAKGTKLNLKVAIPSLAAGNLRDLDKRLSVLQKKFDSTNASAKRFNTTLSTLPNVTGRLATSSTRVNKSLDNTSKSLQNVGKQAKLTTNELRDFGIQSGLAFRRFLAFTIPAGLVFGTFAAARKGVKDAIAFEREMIRIGQVSGQTLKGLSSLENEINSLATTFGTSSSELAGAARQLKQAGISVTDITKVLKTLSQTSLAPTFDNLQQTTEGAIAILAQFGDQVKKLNTGIEVKGIDRLASDLGEINALSKAFAVESGDLIFAIRRTGGAFQAAGGSLQELLALFTSVRSTTRESAQTIATGFRTIFTRLQRPTTIGFLRELGVELTNLDKSGNRRFVGAFEAIGRIAKAIEDLPEGDVRISKIVERLGGFRQVSKVIPLLGQFEKAQRAIQVAQRGQNSLDKDAERGLQSLGVQISRTKEKFLELFRAIVANPAFQTFVRDVLKATNAIADLAKQLVPIIPLIAGFAALRGIFAVAPVARGFLSSFTSRASVFRSQGFSAARTSLGSGGIVGGQGNRDTVPALLTPGEFVINKGSANSLGSATLNKLNKFNQGGPVGLVTGGRVPTGGIGGGGGGFFPEARRPGGQFIARSVLDRLLRQELLKVLKTGDLTRAPKGGLVTETRTFKGGQGLPRSVTRSLKDLQQETLITAAAFSSLNRHVGIGSSSRQSLRSVFNLPNDSAAIKARSRAFQLAAPARRTTSNISGPLGLQSLRSISNTGLGEAAFPGGGVVGSGRGNKVRRRLLSIFGRGERGRGAARFLSRPVTKGLGGAGLAALPFIGIAGGLALQNQFPQNRLASGVGSAAIGAGSGFLVGGPVAAVVGALGGLVVGIRNATKAINDAAVELRVNKINNLIQAAGIKGVTGGTKRGLNTQIPQLFNQIEKQSPIGLGKKGIGFFENFDPLGLFDTRDAIEGAINPILTLKRQTTRRRQVRKDILSQADPNNVLAFFNNALDAANSMEELTEALGPELLGNLTRFIQAAKDEGLLSVSTAELTKIRFSKLRKLAEKESDLLDTTDRLIKVLTGITNLGFEVQDAFSSVANISNNVGAFGSFAGGGLGAANISSSFSGMFQRGFGRGSRQRLAEGVNAIGSQFNLGGEGDLLLNIDKTVRTLGPLLDEFVKTATKTNLGTSSVSDAFLQSKNVGRFFRQNKGLGPIEDALELAFQDIEVSSLKKTIIEAGGAAEFLSNSLGVLDPVLQLFAELLQRSIVAINEWQTQLVAATQAQSRATQQIFDSQLSRLDAAQDLAKNLGEKFELDRFTQLFQQQQSELVRGLGVGGGNDPRALGVLIGRLQEDIVRDRGRLAQGDTSVQGTLTKNLQSLNKANLALGRLADSSVLVAVAQEKLARAQDTNQSRIGIARLLAFGSNKEVRDVATGAGLFGRFQQSFRGGTGKQFLDSLSQLQREQFENFAGRLPQLDQERFNKQLAEVFGMKLLEEPARELFKIQNAAADAQHEAGRLLIEAANKQLEAANRQLNIPQELIRNPGQPVKKGGGGRLSGRGNTDTVPAMLTPGEFVINRRATENNLGLLEAINSGQRLQGGGSVRDRNEELKAQGVPLVERRRILRDEGRGLSGRRSASDARGEGLAARRRGGVGAAINIRDKKLRRRARNRARIRERTRERREGIFGRKSILDFGNLTPGGSRSLKDREAVRNRQDVDRRARARSRGRRRFGRSPEEKLEEAREKVRQFRRDREDGTRRSFASSTERSFQTPRARNFIGRKGDPLPPSRFIRAPGSRGRRAGRNIRVNPTLPRLNVPGIRIEGIIPDEIDDFLLKPFTTARGVSNRKRKKLPRFRGDGRRRPPIRIPRRRFQTGGLVSGKNIADSDRQNSQQPNFEMFQSSVKQMNDGFGRFDASQKELGENLKSFNGTVEHTGLQKVEVVISGLSSFKELMPAIQDMIRQEIGNSLKNSVEGSARLDSLNIGRGKKGGLR